MELLDFNLPPCEWSEVNPAKLSAFMPGTNAVQIGKVLNKLAEDFEMIKKKTVKNVNYYKIPLKRALLKNSLY